MRRPAIKKDSASLPSHQNLRRDLSGWGREVVEVEARALQELTERMGDDFSRAVGIIMDSTEEGGRAVVTGIGKSGLVGRRMSATFNSLGTMSLFLHPVEAQHGDLGMVGARDVVLAVSKSGESGELLALLPSFRRQGNTILALVGNPDSALAREADLVLDCSVSSEACPFGLAPSASCAAAAAMGDALAIALFRARGLTPDDFAFTHPGGALGRRLLLKVKDIMHRGEELPLVRDDDLMSEALLEIARKRLGMTGVVGRDGKLVGIITDGDMKRILMNHADFMQLPVRDAMTRNPRTIGPEEPVTRAIQRMEEDPERLITCLMIVNDAGEPEGVIHLHDCLQAGIA